MKVYPGTSTSNRRNKGASASREVSNTFLHCLTTLTIAGVLLAGIGGFFLHYMSLEQQVRNTQLQIDNTRAKIADTQRSIQTLEDEHASLSKFSSINAKIRQFRLPLVQVQHAQIRHRNMEVMTPLQASQVRTPARRPITVARQNSRRPRY